MNRSRVSGLPVPRAPSHPASKRPAGVSGIFTASFGSSAPASSVSTASARMVISRAFMTISPWGLSAVRRGRKAARSGSAIRQDFWWGAGGRRDFQSRSAWTIEFGGFGSDDFLAYQSREPLAVREARIERLAVRKSTPAALALGQVLLGHLGEVQVKLGGDVGDVPEQVAHFLG